MGASRLRFKNDHEWCNTCYTLSNECVKIVVILAQIGGDLCKISCTNWIPIQFRQCNICNIKRRYKLRNRERLGNGPTPSGPGSSHCPGFTTPSGPGSSHCPGFTINLRYTTLGRPPLNEWSARRTTIHNTHNRQTSIRRRDSNSHTHQASGLIPTP